MTLGAHGTVLDRSDELSSKRDVSHHVEIGFAEADASDWLACNCGAGMMSLTIGGGMQYIAPSTVRSFVSAIRHRCLTGRNSGPRK